MIGDRRISVARCLAGVGDLRESRAAVAPFGVHLQVAAIVLPVTGPSSAGSPRDTRSTSARLRKWRRSWPSPLDVGAAAARVRPPVRRSATRRSSRTSSMTRVEPGPMPEILGNAPSGYQIGQRHVEPEDGRGGALVTEHLLRRRLGERQIAQISAHDGVDVGVVGEACAGHCSRRRSLDRGQRRFGRAGDHLAGRLEARPVTGAVPCAFGRDSSRRRIPCACTWPSAASRPGRGSRYAATFAPFRSMTLPSPRLTARSDRASAPAKRSRIR